MKKRGPLAVDLDSSDDDKVTKQIAKASNSPYGMVWWFVLIVVPVDVITIVTISGLLVFDMLGTYILLGIFILLLLDILFIYLLVHVIRGSITALLINIVPAMIMIWLVVQDPFSIFIIYFAIYFFIVFILPVMLIIGFFVFLLWLLLGIFH